MAAYSQSKIKNFRRCQKQFDFRHGDTYSPPGKELVPKVSPLPLKRGSWLHALQEAHHREWAGLESSWEATHEYLTEEFEQLFDEEKELLGDLPGECERLFRSYLRFWKDDLDRYTVARLPDGSPAIEFLAEASLRKWGVLAPFKGRIDLLVEDREYGGYWIWDAKWVRSLPSPDERMMSPQSLLYPWAVKRCYGIGVSGFLYNYGRTKPPAIPQVLKKGVLSTKVRMDTDPYTYLSSIRSLHGSKWKQYARTIYRKKLKELKGREGMWFRRERIPVDQARVKQALTEFLVTCKDIERRNLKHPPRTYDYRCKFSCSYHDLCVAEFNGLDIAPLIKQKFTFEEERYGEDVEEAD